MKFNKKIIPLIILICLITGSILYFEVFRYTGENGDSIEGSGTIEVTEIEIASKIAGRVIVLPFQEGDRAKKGDLLIKLACDELEARKLSALANLNYTAKTLKRIRGLYSTGSLPQKDLDNAETSFRVAKGNYDYIKASIEQATIFAPINGTVLERNLEIGELAFPGTPIMTLADLTRPWIKIYVHEKRIGLVKLGQRAGVFSDSFNNREFRGKVISIANKAEFTPRTIQTKEERVKLVFAVKIAVENTRMMLKPGIPADAIIYLEEKK